MDLSYLEALMGEAIEEAAEYRDVWVVVRAEAGALAGGSLKLVGKARQMADSLGAYVRALLVGEPDDDLAQTLIAHGADYVVLAAGQPSAAALGDFFAGRQPEILLFPDDDRGKLLAPRLAQRLATGLIPHCVDLELDVSERTLLGIKPIYGGITLQVVACKSKPMMATVVTDELAEPFADPYRFGETETITLEGEPSADAVEPPVEVGPLPLPKAKRIVAAGRGLRDAEGFALARRLAELLGAHLAGSRGAFDEGWIDEEHIIGLHGVRVAPDLYVACGVNGGLEHYLGMEKAKTVVAIHADPDDPIFEVADWGIVGEPKEVVAALIEALEAG